MSVSYSAYAVCGFKLDITSVKKEVTKYDESTGAPYQAKIPSHDMASVDGVPVMDTTENCDALVRGECFCGLEIFKSGFENGTAVLGLASASVGDDGSTCQRDFSEIPVSVPDVVAAFAKERSLTPKLFLIQSCG